MQKVYGHIVEHQGEQGLVGAPLHLKRRYKHAVQAASQGPAQGHDQHHCRLGQAVSQLHGYKGGPKGPHHELPFAADVPKPHFKGQGQGQRDDEQGDEQLDEILHRPPGVAAARDAHGEHLPVEGERVHALDLEQHSTRRQGQHHRCHVGQHLPAGASTLPFDHAEHRLMVFHSSSSFSSIRLSLAMPAGLSSYLLLRSRAPVIIRPSSSLEVLWAWTTPITLP